MIKNMKTKVGGIKMAKIWFRVGMEAEVSEEEMNTLLNSSRTEAHSTMENIIKRAELSGETYILGKDCGAVDKYDNPKNDIDFLF